MHNSIFYSFLELSTLYLHHYCSYGSREELERAVELGQLIGANTDAAVEILINNPAPELVG